MTGLTNEGHRHAVLAPFGPKPLSLAMCMYGIDCRRRKWPVEIGYTQPTAYSDEYSTGVALRDGEPVIHAYCLKLDGRNLYEVPNAPVAM